MANYEYDVPYGISTITITTTGATIVSTVAGYYHGYSVIAGTTNATFYIHDSVSSATGNILDNGMVLANLYDKNPLIYPCVAKNGITITVTGTGAKLVIFYSPKG